MIAKIKIIANTIRMIMIKVNISKIIRNMAIRTINTKIAIEQY